MKSFIIGTLLCIATCISTFGQTKKDTLIAWQQYQKADSLLEARKFKESIALFKKALPTYKKAKAWEREASCYNKLSENLWRTKVIEKSLQYAKKAIDICNINLTKNHPEVANAYDNIGKCYKQKAMYNNVLSNHQKALSVRKKIFPEKHSEIGKSYSNIGVYYYYIGNYPDAIRFYEKALAIYLKVLDLDHIKIGNIYNNLGIIYSDMEKLDIALNYYRKALAIEIKNRGENHLETAFNYTNISDTYYHMNQLNIALEYSKKALSIFKQANDTYGLMAIYNNIGTMYKEKGEPDKQLQYYKKAVNLSLEIFGENHPKTAAIYNNIGISYPDPEKKIFYTTKSLEINKNTFGENHFEVAKNYKNLGEYYKDKEQYDTALTYAHKALKIRQNIFFDENHSHISDSYLSIGNIHAKKGSYTKALDYYTKSLAILQGLSEQHFMFHLSIVHHNIADLHYKHQKYQQALSSFDKAIQYNTRKSNSIILKNTFDPNHYYQLTHLLQTFTGKAKTLQERYKKDNTTEDLDKSIILYQHLDQLVDHLRLSYQNHNDKVSLAEQAKKMYRDAITAQLLAYRTSQDPLLLEKARYYAGKSKSNILKDLLLDTNAKNFSELPKDITELETTLKSNRAFYKSQIVTEQSKDDVNIKNIQEYESKLLAVDRKQDSLTQFLEQEYPKYYQLKHQNTVISATEIQQKLDEKTTIIEFFTSDSITYAFSISKNNIAVKELATPRLKKHISIINNAIIAKNNKLYTQLGYQLYKEIIAPIKENLTGDHLVIIPDSFLWNLNFELLLTQQNTNKNPKKLPYLLRDYAISYANSTTLLFNPFQQKTQLEDQEDCLAFSFSDSLHLVESKNMSLATLRGTEDDLPGTRKEIKAIANIINGDYYYGAKAVEQNFKKNASNYKILHLALHGEVDNQHPENSKLFFSKVKDTLEDNVLYSHELLALDIPAELAVLSACNTGTGKIANGEGIMSLGNAFQYAGTKSLLLSSWAISDKTTPQLMHYFYENLKDGMDKSKALQQAKLSYLNNIDLYRAAPFYWGGFYLVGDPTPIDFGGTTSWNWIVGLGILIFLTLLYLLINNRKNKYAK